MEVPAGPAVSFIAVVVIVVSGMFLAFTTAFELSPLAWAQVSGAPITVPVPAVTGPVPATEDSHPFAAAGVAQTPIDLAAYAYVDEEFFNSGSGYVYRWHEDGGLGVRARGLEYTTRILVRRPPDAHNVSSTPTIRP